MYRKTQRSHSKDENTERERREVRGLIRELDRSVNNMQELPVLQKQNNLSTWKVLTCALYQSVSTLEPKSI